jgi:hypothetical protein
MYVHWKNKCENEVNCVHQIVHIGLFLLQTTRLISVKVRISYDKEQISLGFNVISTSVRNSDLKTLVLSLRSLICTINCYMVYTRGPVTVAERSKACTVFARSEAVIVGSNSTQGMDV